MRSLHTDTRVSVCVCLLSHQFVDLANLLFTFSINRIEGCLNNPLVIFMVATLMSKDRSEESLPRCRFAPNRFQIPLFRFVNDPTHPNDERFAPPSHPLHPPPHPKDLTALPIGGCFRRRSVSLGLKFLIGSAKVGQNSRPPHLHTKVGRAGKNK